VRVELWGEDLIGLSVWLRVSYSHFVLLDVESDHSVVGLDPLLITVYLPGYVPNQVLLSAIILLNIVLERSLFRLLVRGLQLLNVLAHRLVLLDQLS
jgi:hypothetical protein